MGFRRRSQRREERGDLAAGAPSDDFRAAGTPVFPAVAELSSLPRHAAGSNAPSLRATT